MRLLRVLLVAVACALLAPAAPASAQSVNTAVDVAIAIDTTGSMSPSIEQAKLDARKIVSDTQQQLPNARFAIIQFRDEGDTPEYKVEQGMTGDADLVSVAVSRLKADGGGDSPESYNLVFHRAATDGSIGYRNGAARLLFVIGDAEPHGAGSRSLSGCSDRSKDPHQLNTLTTLGELRDAQITLNMVLQNSSAQTTLRCYQSLVDKTFGNGTAKASGSSTGGCGGVVEDTAATSRPRTTPRIVACPPPTPCDPSPDTVCALASPAAADYAEGGLAKAVGDSIAASLPRLTLAGAKKVGSGGRFTLTLRARNDAGRSVFLRTLALALPSGYTTAAGSGGTVTWKVSRKLAPGASKTLKVTLRAPKTAGRSVLRARAAFKMPDGGAFTAKAARSATVG